MNKPITSRELQDYFISNKNFVKNGPQVLIVMKENGRFDIQLTLENDEMDRSSYEIYDEVCDASELMKSYGIKTLNDLKMINASIIWSKYFDGDSEVVFSDFDGDNICFRKFGGKVSVCCPQFNYSDEVNDRMTMLEHFKEYVKKNRDVVMKKRTEKIVRK